MDLGGVLDPELDAEFSLEELERVLKLINHEKLWQKSLQLGISSRIVRIIAELYSKATLRVRTPEGLTKETEITEGVLQGEILSPLLFILFISDMENVFRSKGSYSVGLNHKTDVLLLKYADDLAILGRNVADVRTKLKILKQYCDKNSLTVNESKTKILYCNGGGKRPSGLKFLYGSTELEIVNEFTYLGIVFSSSGVFRTEMKSAVAKARLAAAKLHNIERIHTLFNTMVSSVLLYGCQIWSLRYMEEIERVQTSFYKSILGLTRTTGNALVKVEVGRLDLAVQVWELTWNWVVRILEMGNHRLPLICFRSQVDRYEKSDKSTQFNWAAQIFDFINSLDPSFTYLANAPVAHEWRTAGPALLGRLKLNLQQSIGNQVLHSHYFQIQDTRILFDRGYLKLNIPLVMKKVFAQLRMASQYYVSLYLNGNSYSFNPELPCPTCNTFTCVDTLSHFVLNCPLHMQERIKLFSILGHKPPPL
ncbi:uncharacterized protein LOC107046621 [Diachasma alloeum]|uniref:uncharacterized protein LOC107046621 n=1 Tax=Diachasma alloeum TaxID=454923 RepID=UPI0007381EBE|nr:uncharacterized protein LOC107046621 [Diachasma alloeum]